METTNARCSVGYLSISMAGAPGDARRAAIDAAARSHGGSVYWRTNPTAERSYALIELPDGNDVDVVAAAGERLYETGIIAWAVFPTVSEALPPLIEALGGAGRPAGVLACHPCPGGAIVEWDPALTALTIVTTLVDVELRRFNSGRRAELLSPMPAQLAARIAAQGLQAPEIGADRVLEMLIER